MLLLDELRAWDGTTAQLVARIRSRCPLLEDGRLPAVALLEYLAQAAGCVSGLVQREKGREVEVGFLLGTRELVLEVDSLAVGDELELTATRTFGDDKLGSIHCIAMAGGRRVAEATLTVLAERLRPLGAEP
jgi:predicted hotdog family 3-hydroxylacyl-ACP dehydratase